MSQGIVSVWDSRKNLVILTIALHNPTRMEQTDVQNALIEMKNTQTKNQNQERRRRYQTLIYYISYS